MSLALYVFYGICLSSMLRPSNLSGRVSVSVQRIPPTGPSDIGPTKSSGYVINWRVQPERYRSILQSYPYDPGAISHPDACRWSMVRSLLIRKPGKGEGRPE